MNMQNTSVRLAIPADAHFIDIVRLTLFGLASKIGFSYEDIEDMKVAVSEACNNAVLHAYDEENKGLVEIEFKLLEQGISISIKDTGTSFDFEHALGKAESLHEKELQTLRSGGLGIYMMQALMDEVEVMNESGTEVILTKFLNRIEGENLHEFKPVPKGNRGS